MTSVGDPDSTYGFVYDILGRVTSVSNAGTPGLPEVVLTQTFDAVGNRTSLSATVDSTLDFLTTYTYDDLHRLTRVTQQGQSGGNAVAEKRVDFAYNALGQFTTITRFSDLAGSNEVVESVYTYDSFARLTDLSHNDSTPDTVNDLRQYTWTYDALNRITQFTSPDGTVDYTYDDTNQLTGADYDTGSGITDENYTYDEAGNRTNVGYTTGDTNQLLSDGVYNYEYDNEGNRIRRTHISSGEVTEYEWDYRNRLVGISTYASLGGTLTHSVVYTYDVFDRRIEKAIDTNADATPERIERYIYDGEHIALVFDGLDNNELTNRYLHGPAVDQILADEQLLNGILDEVYWPLTDHLGSVRDLVDSQGEVENHIVYDSFGNILSETDPSIEHLFAYTGREHDAESDLYYYDPAVGRFVSEDPIGFSAGDVNIYRYVGNTSTIYTDPSGLIPYIGVYDRSTRDKATYRGIINDFTTPNSQFPDKPNFGKGRYILGYFDNTFHYSKNVIKFRIPNAINCEGDIKKTSKPAV
ncbi:RHS repeat-associated core domain protein [Planctomycetales bacterium 10988]|nr:RHS repeat-associated core domain protein [Planctomycetales bacterium 10988]